MTGIQKPFTVRPSPVNHLAMAVHRVRVLAALLRKPRGAGTLVAARAAQSSLSACIKEVFLNRQQGFSSASFLRSLETHYWTSKPWHLTTIRYPGATARYSTSSDYSKELDDINSKFAEAREEIELASESKDTVYFDDEVATAMTAVKTVLDKYEALLARLDDKEKGVVQRSMGLKMEQLKAEAAQLKE